MGIGNQGYGTYILPLIGNLRSLGRSLPEARRREEKRAEKPKK
jgi:hypothetical protein